jgi:hypothetical protein
MRKIKIGISGSHSTGKSTFIKQLEKSLIDKCVKFKSVSDLAIQCPLPILLNHTVESALWIASKGIADEIETEHKHEVVIVDRPILDCWAYFNAACKDRYEVTNPKLQTLKSLISNWLPTYDIIYQTVIDESIPIEDKKGRVLDEEYRIQIGIEMIDTSRQFNITPRLLTYTNKDTELEFILKQIDNAINKV